MKKKIKILTTIGILSTALLCGCHVSPVSQKDELPELVIGRVDYPPYHYINVDGKYEGVDVELAYEACRRMGYEAVFRSIRWDEKNQYLENGEVDCLWDCFSINGREEEYQWVGPYAYSDQVVVVPAESEINALEELEGKQIAVQMGSKPEDIFLNRTEERIPEVRTVFCLLNINEVLSAVRRGYVDACVGHQASLTQILDDADAQYRILDEVLLRAELGVAFSLHDNSKLPEKLDCALDEMMEDGTVEAILTKYGLAKDVLVREIEE